MKIFPEAVVAAYTSPTQTLTRCLRIERQDGRAHGLTEHDQPLTVQGLAYLPGLQTSAVSYNSTLAVSTVEIEFPLQLLTLSASELLAGLLERSYLVLFEVNYSNLFAGSLLLWSGTIGNLAMHGNHCTLEGRSLAQRLQLPQGALYSTTCRARLGDARCTVKVEEFTVDGIPPVCDKRLTTCHTRFNNALNFRGEPYIQSKKL